MPDDHLEKVEGIIDKILFLSIRNNITSTITDVFFALIADTEAKPQYPLLMQKLLFAFYPFR